jgi:hypothetical protein
MLLLTLAIAGSSIVYTKYAKRQWRVMSSQLKEMQEQTTINRQQLVGTQAALLHFSGVSFDRSGEIAIALNNAGHVTAADVRFRVEVTRETIRDQRQIGEPFVFDPLHIEPIKAGDSWSPANLFTPWRPHQLAEEHTWPPNWPGNETFVFRGNFSYQDGFGGKQTGEFCQQWLPNFEIKTKVGISGGGGLYSCDQFKLAIPSILDQEKKAEQERGK